MIRDRFKKTPENLELLRQPQDKQRVFFRTEARYVAFGGARGGGKSWALRRKCVLLSSKYAGIRILLLRRTLTDLRENHILQLQSELGNAVYYSNDERAMYFPNKSRIKFGYLDSESDLLQYQGQEYDVICIDEATQFTEDEFLKLNACIRGGNPKHPKRCYLSCNPGGIGHAWVKRLFIDRDFKKDTVIDGKIEPGEIPEDYAFIRSLSTDNIYNGDGYMRQLDRLPSKIRAAWRDGDWDIFTGQYFTEWDENIHVCKPFNIPNDWNRYYVNDYGLDALAGLWIAVDYNENAYVYREVFEGKDAEDDGIGLMVSQAALKIKSLETTQETNSISVRIAPVDLWSRSGNDGKTQAELFSEHGIYFIKAAMDRINGWMALHEWLMPKDGKSKLKICSNCVNLIRTLPLLQFDEKKSNDVECKVNHKLTHLPDALRYWAISRPFANQQAEVKQDNRFEFEEEQSNDDFFTGEITHDYLYGGWNRC